MGCSFFPKPIPISVLEEWLKECQARFDLSEPLAAELFLPAKKKSLYVGR
jgi:hypothetical protein